MPYKGKGTFDTGYIGFGGYFHARIKGTISLTLNDDITRLGVTLKFDNDTYFSNGSEIGGGFWNSVIVGWADQSNLFIEEEGERSWRKGLAAEDDTEAYAKSDLKNFVGNSRWDDVFIGISADDSKGTSGATHYWAGGNPAGKTYSKTFNVSKDTFFDASGKAKSIFPLFIARRSYKWSGLPASEHESVTKYIAIEGLPPIIEGLDWDYYPWAIKIGNKWKSCNRLRANDAHDAEHASYRMKKSSRWTDCLNSIYKPLNEQHGYIKVSNKWSRQTTTGEED